MFSKRFQQPIRVTRHAAARMVERNMDDALLLDLIETDTAKYKDDIRVWIYKRYPGRNDNLLCAAVILETELVVKTVMQHVTLE